MDATTPEPDKFALYMGLLAGFDFVACMALMLLSNDSKLGSGSQSQGFGRQFWDDQVVHFRFSGSLFDMICISLVRSIILSYYYFYKKRRSHVVIAVVTSISLAYCVVKYALWAGAIYLAPALLLASFILPCLETWLFVAKGKISAPVLLRVTPGFRQINEETQPLLDLRPASNYYSTATTVTTTNRTTSMSDPVQIRYHSPDLDEDQFATPPEGEDSLSARRSHSNDVQHAQPQPQQQLPLQLPRDDITSRIQSLLRPDSSAEEAACRAKLTKALIETMEMAKTDQGWKFVTERKGVTVHERPDSRTGGNMMKGVIKVPYAPRVVAAFTRVLDERKAWNSGIKSQYVVQVYDPRVRAVCTALSAPFPVSAREFVYIEGFVVDSDGTVVSSASSIEHSAAISSNVIRAEILVSGYYITPISTNPVESSVTYIYSIDLKGWIPTAVVARANLDQPLCLSELRVCLDRYVAKHGTDFAFVD